MEIITAIEEPSGAVTLTLAPVPSQDRLIVDVGVGVEMRQVIVAGLNGQQIAQFSFRTREVVGRYEISLAGYASGTYIVIVDTPVGRLSRRFVKN
ncbi:T9SS type A sorting domain-containing protein [Spirosoma taeanense]|uniref:T9SS type A sorting domain-containing protein n=1 Tax=Spirosoma taeanense TaxID=2735870 RepID=A0A6M5Y2X0_9BACT|nr:T9SS type A sorting domain-containing protein [Spirosoma taeanense]QJW88149.1 T9SS type A sorting domain-containing protein [Spirosoma taeanense]